MLGLSRPTDAQAADNKNILLLIYLRWIAVAGQIVTIAIVHLVFHIAMPLVPMGGVIAFLIALNIVSLHRFAHGHPVGQAALFVELLFDVAALTIQLYLSGGATNPFITLFLLQVILGAVLLDGWGAWALAGISCASFFWLMHQFVPIMPMHHGGIDGFFELHVWGMFICFVLASCLLVLFTMRINQNLRERDAALAALRQQAVEEHHIIRMGLLASGAAHELGTPLSSLSVILGDWARLPVIAGDEDLAADVTEMQSELQRCKTIVSGILMSAGEVRGENPVVTNIRDFLSQIVTEWQERSAGVLCFDERTGEDILIVSDPALRQVIGNVIDNALEASPGWVGISASCSEDLLILDVEDQGPGFTPAMMEAFGKPYSSTKGRAGSGLGLFLVVNVLRKLGGRVEVANRQAGGAQVRLTIPLGVLAYARGRAI